MLARISSVPTSPNIISNCSAFRRCSELLHERCQIVLQAVFAPDTVHKVVVRNTGLPVEADDRTAFL